MQIFVSVYPNLLSISNILISSKLIKVINSAHRIHRSGHWSWVLTFVSAGDAVSFFNVWDSIANVHAHPPLGLSVLKHNVLSPSEIAIRWKWPRYLLVTLLILWNSFREGKTSTFFFALVVILLNGVELQIFIPVTDFGFVIVLWATL